MGKEMDENSCIYYHHKEDGYWECIECGNVIQEEKEWYAAHNCPGCGKAIWFEDTSLANDFSRLFSQ